MLSHEIAERLAPIFERTRESGVLFPEWMLPATSVIGGLSLRCSEIYDKIDRVASGDLQYSSVVPAEIQRLIADVRLSLVHSTPRKFFESYELMLHTFRQLMEIEVDSDYLERFVADIEVFAEMYDDYLANPRNLKAWPLLRQAHVVDSQLTSILGTLYAIYRRLGQQDHSEATLEDRSSFSLSLPGSDDYHIVVSRLSAIARLYSEICRLLGVSEHDAPLKVIKIESGSLWVKVLGESRVVGLMIRFVEQGAAFIYRTYTQEGKIAVVPQKVDAVDRLIGLRKALHENGIDTATMDEEINAAAIAIAKGLNQVLKGQPSIQMNGKTHSIGGSDLGHYQIEEKELRMLEHLAEDKAGSDDLPA